MILSKYILLGVVAVAAFILMDPARIRWFVGLFRRSQPKRVVQFEGSVQLEWDGHFWSGDTVLPAWAGFQECLGAYSSHSSASPSDGKVHLSVRSPTDAEDTVLPPSAGQQSAFLLLRDNDELMRKKVVQAIFDEYPKMRESFADFFGEDLEDKMPLLQSPADLKALIGLSTVHIGDVEKDGFAYLGFEFGCDWEEEHGLGVMTHKDRIIEVGDAETAFATHGD